MVGYPFGGTSKTVIIMFKRVTFVFALLFTHSAMAQTLEVSVPAPPDTFASGTPVVMELSATGTVATGSVPLPGLTASSSAEVETITLELGTTTATTSEFGAFGTSTGSTTVSTTSVEEESTPSLPEEEGQRLFDLVFAGFEEFVRITLGWE